MLLRHLHAENFYNMNTEFRAREAACLGTLRRSYRPVIRGHLGKTNENYVKTV